jgi:hypothetical protein
MTRSKPPGHPLTQVAERPASGGPLAAVRAFRLVLAAAVLCAAMGASAGAQSWQSRINDSGALMSGVAFVPGNTLAFSCTAPSPSGRQLIETGDHEAQRTDTPFTMIVTIGAGLLDPFVDGSDLAQPLATLDATTFGLTTHVGSLPRTQKVVDFIFARERGEAYDEADFDAAMTASPPMSAVCRAGRRWKPLRNRRRPDVDIVSDGETSKISYATYVKDRYTGFDGDSPRNAPADLKLFPSFLERLANDGGTPKYARPMCVGEVKSKGRANWGRISRICKPR